MLVKAPLNLEFIPNLKNSVIFARLYSTSKLTGDLKMFIRSNYLDQLLNHDPQQPLKILVGVRRSGKSTLLEQVRASLRRQGVTNDQLHTLRFNRYTDPALRQPKSLLAAIKKELTTGKPNYLFLDELEFLTDCSEILVSLAQLPKLTVFITGSSTNSLTMTAPIRDQCQVIPIFPLTFSEYLAAHHWQPSAQHLHHYLNTGGFPLAQQLRGTTAQQNYIEDLLNTTIMEALTRQNTRCNPAFPIELATVLAKRDGQATNVSQAVAALADHNLIVSNKTLSTYLKLLQDVFLFLPCYEYNTTTGKVKTTNVRYYPIDPAVTTYLSGHRKVASQLNFEALIFSELCARGYYVYTSTVKVQAVNFLAVKGHHRHYIQFTYSLTSQKDYQQAVKPLLALPHDADRTLIIAKKPQALIDYDPQIPLTSLLDWLTDAA